MSIVAQSAHSAVSSPTSDMTVVELTWREQRIEYWIRFGQPIHEHILDRHRRQVGFAPASIFAFVRWASNDHGTLLSRIDIVRAIDRGETFQTLPFVRPGGDILLKLQSWPKVARVLEHIDTIDAEGVDPCEVPAEHWRHLHHRVSADIPPHRYTAERHAAWLKRRSAGP